MNPIEKNSITLGGAGSWALNNKKKKNNVAFFTINCLVGAQSTLGWQVNWQVSVILVGVRKNFWVLESRYAEIWGQRK